MNAFGITDKGKVRSANQDAYRLSLSPDGEYVLAALCDGMGGVHGGEIASAVAADSFMQYAEICCAVNRNPMRRRSCAKRRHMPI